MSGLPLVILLLASTAAAATASATPPSPSALSASAPYTELVAHRLTAAGAPRVGTWSALCLGNATGLTALPLPVAASSVLAAAIVHDAVTHSAAAVRLLADGSTDCALLKVAGVSWEGVSAVAWPADGTNVTLLVVAPKGLSRLTCAVGDASKSVTCSVMSTTAVAFQTVAAVAGSRAETGLAAAATASGIYRLRLTSTGGATAERLSSDPALTIAVCGPQGLVVAGTSDKVFVYTAGAATPRWEWVTDLAAEAGGAYDAPATALACDEADGTVFVATIVALNVRTPSGAVLRYDYTEGLPVNGSSSVAVEPETGAVFVGAPGGLVRWSRGQDMDADWRFFHGPRYLPPGTSAIGAVACTANVTFVAVDGGLTLLERQTWTLAQKAAHYQTILEARHDRHGMVAECALSAFGDVRNCTSGPSDNNGLWTSLVVVAEACRVLVDGADGTAAKSLAAFVAGMKRLVDVTGVPGLMARSCVAPGEPAQAGDTWHNSSNPALKGWQWKADASSDEVVGHGFAYPTVVALLGTASGSVGATALQLLEDIVGYILSNDYYLIDVTGLPTRWGVWNPTMLNGNQSWSDERGLNSMQIISYIAAAQRLSNSSHIQDLSKKAFAELTNSTNQYLENMLNLKIETPIDDNYSDDELAFLPYYVLLSMAERGTPLYTAARASMERSWLHTQPLRSALWNTIYLATHGTAGTQADLEAIGWNLRTWPLELIDWPVQNSQRRDLTLALDTDRAGNIGSDSRTRILPAFERSQQRWNSNPHDLDGGSGMSEGDPGAWLAPYWLARYHGLIDN